MRPPSSYSLIYQCCGTMVDTESSSLDHQTQGIFALENRQIVGDCVVFSIYFLFKSICALHGNCQCTVFHMIMASVFSPSAFTQAALIYYFYVWAVMKSSVLVLCQHNPKDYHIKEKALVIQECVMALGLLGYY